MKTNSNVIDFNSDLQELTLGETDHVGGGLGPGAVVIILVVAGFAAGAGGAYVVSLVAKK